MTAFSTPTPDAGDGLEAALALVAASSGERDRAPVPRFPTEAIAALEHAGALAFNADAGRTRPPAAAELELVRRVARADGSVGRIFDGHLNAIERLAVQAPPELRERELEAVRAGRLRAGVWGGDPRPGEGPPAGVARSGGGEVLRGVKTFCSGAGGLDRALVLARDPAGGPPPAVWVDLRDGDRVEVDESWYRGYGLRASVSHRVVFHDARILARFGAPGALTERPWFSRDALRTASTWAGMADSAAEAACTELSRRPARGALEGLAAGQIETSRRAISLWIDAGARAMDGGRDLPGVALHARAGIARECRALLDEASRACGSWPFATAQTLDRCRRDLEVFLLQHRLEPMLERAGTAALDSLDAEDQVGDRP
jgi:alkylation response protein AidB-like acyl-CoA dehydrogenase